jgi:hypothetical protein
MHFYYFSVLSHVNTDVNINGWYLRAFVLSVSLFLLSVLLSLSSYLLTYWSNIFFRSVCYICTCSKYQTYVCLFNILHLFQVAFTRIHAEFFFYQHRCRSVCSLVFLRTTMTTKKMNFAILRVSVKFLLRFRNLK